MFVYDLMGIEFFMVFMLNAFVLLLLLSLLLMMLMQLLPPLGKFTTEVNETYAPSMRMEVRWSV